MNPVQETSLMVAEKSPELVKGDGMMNPYALAHGYSVAVAFAGSKMVPEEFRGDVDSCLIALFLARRMGEEPLTLMQNTYFVHGRPGYSTTYLLARARQAGFSFRWETEVDKSHLVDTPWGHRPNVIVTCTVSDENGEVGSEKVDLWTAQEDGWTTKRGSKYKAHTERMLKYRATTAAMRFYCPEVILGMTPMEELDDAMASQAVSAAQSAAAEQAQLVELQQLLSDIKTAGGNEPYMTAAQTAAMKAATERTKALPPPPAINDADLIDLGQAKPKHEPAKAPQPQAQQEPQKQSEPKAEPTPEPKPAKRGRPKMTEEEKAQRAELAQECRRLETMLSENVLKEAELRPIRNEVFGQSAPSLGRQGIEPLSTYKAKLEGIYDEKFEVEEPEALPPEPEPSVAPPADDGAEREPPRETGAHAELRQLGIELRTLVPKGKYDAIIDQIVVSGRWPGRPSEEWELPNVKAFAQQLRKEVAKRKVAYLFQQACDEVGPEEANALMTDFKSRAAIEGLVKGASYVKLSRLIALFEERAAGEE